MEAALYDPDGGFFAPAGGAGRAGGDFLTSVEVGSLFGALIARAVDGWWDQLGRPDPFLVIDAGAGRGQLARDVLRAPPGVPPPSGTCWWSGPPGFGRSRRRISPWSRPSWSSAPPSRPSPTRNPLGSSAGGPIVAALAELPAGPVTGVVVANELADNLPFRIVERAAGGWNEIRVATSRRLGSPSSSFPAEEGWPLGRRAARRRPATSRSAPGCRCRRPSPTGSGPPRRYSGGV